MNIIITLLLFVAVGFLAAKILVIRAKRPLKVDRDSARVISEGEIVGVRLRHMKKYAWLGIPFAEPPVGDLRWRAPRPPKSWDGVFEASTFGNRPSQLGGIGGGYPKALVDQPVGDEDCLYLNVWAPAMTASEAAHKSEPLPVMVWIYGGGNAVGAADVPLYSQAHATAQENAIVVSMNYRLGILGWFRHPCLFDEQATEEDRSGNFGTLDIVEALRWVQRNIRAFGGDPNNVTVFGESAGGINTSSLMISPVAKGLFHRAIAQSPIMTSYSIANAENYADDAEPGHRSSSREVICRLLVAAGRAKDRDEAKTIQDSMSNRDLREFLYQLSPQELQKIFQGEMDQGLYSTPRPVEDGTVLPQMSWLEAFATPDCLNQVPFMVGATKDEYKAFICSKTTHYIDVKLGLIPKVRNPDQYELDSRYASRLWHAAVGEHALRLAEHLDAPVFLYRFDWDDWPNLFGINFKLLMGAFHASELFFLFGIFQRYPWMVVFFGRQRFNAMLSLSERLQSYWQAFARHGDPKSGIDGTLPVWPELTQSERRFMVLGATRESLCDQACDPITMEKLRDDFLTDDQLVGDDEKARTYANIFAYGMHGNWETTDNPELKRFTPGGEQRALVDKFAKELLFRP